MEINDLTLMHYADAPVNLDRARTYAQESRLKPRGLWVSVQGDDDWPSWCRSEEWGTERLTHPHAVTLMPDANLLLVDTYEGVKGLPDRYPAEVHSWTRDLSPDWQAIAAEYDGIIIAPYQWEARWEADSYWYYGWDCASGCIWNLDAIAGLAPAGREISRV